MWAGVSVNHPSCAALGIHAFQIAPYASSVRPRRRFCTKVGAQNPHRTGRDTQAVHRETIMYSPIRILSVAMCLFCAGVASAGTVRVETTVATEVRMAGVPVVKTYSAGTVSLPDVEAGQHAFEVFRFGKARSITVDVPETGTVRLMVGEESLTTDTPPADPSANAPVVRLKATTGQRFSILVDGKRSALLHADRPLMFDHLPPGAHELEVRSIDNLTIWARGTLDLQPGDELELIVAEGRLPEVFGRAEAWRPK